MDAARRIRELIDPGRIKNFLNSVNQDAVVVLPKRLIRPFDIPHAHNDLLRVEDVPQAQDDHTVRVGLLQALECRYQLALRAPGHVIHQDEVGPVID